MNQYDIRTVDSEDPNTPANVIKAMKSSITDADDKFETFDVTHEPINLKAKLAVKKKAVEAKANAQAELDRKAEEERMADKEGTVEG